MGADEDLIRSQKRHDEVRKVRRRFVPETLKQLLRSWRRPTAAQGDAGFMEDLTSF
jgi:hypothetical protein